MTTSPARPGLLDRLRGRFPVLDHAVRAEERYTELRGDFFAAGISYYTAFALFPLLMVGFSVGGFLLAGQPHLLAELDHRIRASVPGDSGQQLIELMDSAIASRASVGVVGLATAAWAGLGWMANLRGALSVMWGQPFKKTGFVAGKLSDLAAMVSAFALMLLTLGLTALGSPKLIGKALDWLGVPDFALLGVLLWLLSLTMSLAVSWLLLTWIIGRLPREPVGFAVSMRAGALGAVALEVFKQLGSAYLRSVVDGPAGAVFGPVLGLLVFAYITARLVLFSAAWAAVAE